MLFPKPFIETYDGFQIVRDDVIPGGTKRRVIDCLLKTGGEFVYASPAYGYAQVALAYACRDIGAKAVIFTAKRAVMHERTAEAKNAGAKIIMIPHGYLSNVQSKARAYTDLTGATLLPFGLDVPEFADGFANVAREMNIKPPEVWTASGSGVLTKALQTAWPDAVFHAVQVGAVRDCGRAKIYVAQEKFEHDARRKPPFPSCSNYDAKAWVFMKQFASPGALFWNVAA